MPPAGSEVSELPTLTVRRKQRPDAYCPSCGAKGRSVEGQTVKALLSDSLKALKDDQYYFCRTDSCRVVYYTADGSSTFTTADVRERVYQKEANADDVFICYCFRHTVGDVRHATVDRRDEILRDINSGIQADQCACDLRNPQGSCCLGNVRDLIAKLEPAKTKNTAGG